MPMKIDDYNDGLVKYSEIVKKLRINLYKKMKGYVLDEREMNTFVSETMSSLMETYWKRNRFTGATEYVIRNELSDVIEKAAAPSTTVYYRLRNDAFHNIFKESPEELYHQSPEYFKMYFELLEVKEQKDVISALFSLERRNDEVDQWLSKKYPALVKQVGMDSVGDLHAD